MLAEDIYEIPKQQNLSLTDIEDAGIVSAQMMRKWINEGKMQCIRVGKKFFIPRKILIQWLQDQLDENKKAS